MMASGPEVMNTPAVTEDHFRDKIATVDKQGKRIWIYPKKPSGRYTNYRTIVAVSLLTILFGLPLIKFHGEPLVLFNILERNFIILGMHFAPQDFYLFAIAMLIFLVFIILFTVIFGRLFCGWVCPQTIFMEMVYCKIEYWIEGDYTAQKKLDVSPFTLEKGLKKISKHLVFFIIAVLIANTFLSYIIGIDQVMTIIREPVSLHKSGFTAMILFSVVFYLVFARLREQVCTTICPYGRLQGVMLDNRSLVVAYDFVRGEPRGKIRRAHHQETFFSLPVAEAAMATALPVKHKGDCIDCKLCVHVCPTGIDVRNGTQLECIHCTACMDACDQVMEKIHRPKGLIRMDSIDSIVNGTRRLFSPRARAYSLVLLLLVAIEFLLFSLRSDVEVLFLRTGGLLYQEHGDGTISNLYNYQLINKTSKPARVTFRLLSPAEGTIEMVGDTIPFVDKNQTAEGAVFLRLSKAVLQGGKNSVIVGAFVGEKCIAEVKTGFFSPVQ